MKSSFPISNSSLSEPEKLNLLLNQFNSSPDLKSKEVLLNEISNQNKKLVINLIEKIQFETLTMLLDECPNLDDIFLFLELIYKLKKDIATKLMEYLFILDTEEQLLPPSFLKEKCLHYLENNLKVKSFQEAIDKLNNEIDERKIALLLTDIAIINEEIAKRLLWELFSKFKESNPKHFRDSLKILKWASEDLFLVISIVGTEKLLQSESLKSFNSLLTLFISEDSELIYPLIIDVPDSKLALTNLINNSNTEDIIDFLKIIENHSPDYMESLVNFNFDKKNILVNFSKARLKTRLIFFQLILEFKDSVLYQIFINDTNSLLKSLIFEIKNNFNLEDFYLCLSFFNTVDTQLAQELLINIDPKLVTEQLISGQNENIVIDSFITVTSTNKLYLFYSLQADFPEFITWFKLYITKLEDLETLALFLVSFHKIFSDAPELPLILTIIVKKLQRVENLDDLGVFLGIIGNSEPQLLSSILNNLLPHLKLYPTDKIGYLLMATSLYDLETGFILIKDLSARFSSEYDIKLLRKSFESMILANAKIAEALLKDEKFNVMILKKHIKNSDVLEKALFLETILPVGKEIISQILQDQDFVTEFYQGVTNLSLSELKKLISNSRWLDEEMCDELGRILAVMKFDLDEYYSLINTSSWSNRLLCIKIVYWTDLSDLGERIENWKNEQAVIDNILSILYELNPEKTDKLIKDYFPNQE